MTYLKNKLILICLLAFALMAFMKPPETKAQARIIYDTLKTGSGVGFNYPATHDSAHTITLDPYGGEITLTFIDSSNSSVDTFKVYQIIRGHLDTVGVCGVEQASKFDSVLVCTTFIPGDNTQKTYKLKFESIGVLRIVRTNANGYAPKSYYIITCSEKLYNSIEDKRMFAEKNMNFARTIEDKLKYSGKENYLLPNPFELRASSYKKLRYNHKE